MITTMGILGVSKLKEPNVHREKEKALCLSGFVGLISARIW